MTGRIRGSLFLILSLLVPLLASARPAPGAEQLASYASLRRRALGAARRLPQLLPDQPRLAKRISTQMGKALELSEPRRLHSVYPASEHLAEAAALDALSRGWVAAVADFMLATERPEVADLPLPAGAAVEEFITRAAQDPDAEGAGEHRVQALHFLDRFGVLEAGWRVEPEPEEPTPEPTMAEEAQGDEPTGGGVVPEATATPTPTPTPTPSPRSFPSSPSTRRKKKPPPAGFFFLVGIIGLGGGGPIAFLFFRHMAKRGDADLAPTGDPGWRPSQEPDAVLPLRVGEQVHTFELWRKSSGEVLVFVDKRMVPGQLEQAPGSMSQDSTTRFPLGERSLLAHVLDGREGLTYDLSLDGTSLTTGEPVRETKTALGPAFLGKIVFAVAFVGFPLALMALQGGAVGAGIGFTSISICFAIERQEWLPLWTRYLACILVVLVAWFLFIQIVGFALGFIEGFNAARGN